LCGRNLQATSAAVAVTIAMACGCSSQAAPPATVPAAAASDKAPADKAPADKAPADKAPADKATTRAIDVELVDHAAVMKRVEAAKGKVVVLDCWSTSCPPCIKEFPGLVALAEKHAADVVCMSLAFDYDGVGKPEDVLPPVREFLERVGAGKVHNMLGREEADVLSKKFDLVSVPAVYVWKPDGSLARRFDDDDAAQRLGRPFTYADVTAEVLTALGK
jgi:thiol-disulfide isomerase/thioredoxin